MYRGWTTTNTFVTVVPEEGAEDEEKPKDIPEEDGENLECKVLVMRYELKINSNLDGGCD